MAKLTGGEGWSLNPAKNNTNSASNSIPKGQQVFSIKTEKRSKGKSVTVIDGLKLNTKDLKKLSKTLKSACGAGGTIVDQRIEIQGDFVNKIDLWLKSNGWGT